MDADVSVVVAAMFVCLVENLLHRCSFVLTALYCSKTLGTRFILTVEIKWEKLLTAGE